MLRLFSNLYHILWNQQHLYQLNLINMAYTLLRLALYYHLALCISLVHSKMGSRNGALLTLAATDRHPPSEKTFQTQAE